MKENDITILRGLVAWCENKRIDLNFGEVLMKDGISRIINGNIE